MAVGHSDDVDLEDAVDEVIAQCRATLGDRQPQAGILIASFDTFDPSIVARVREAFDGVDIMGATSAAEISSASGYREDSTALALFVSDTVDITVGLGRGLSVAVDRACREAAEQALGATERDPRICIVFAGMNRIDPQHVLDAMADALPAGVAVVGGGSGRSDGDPSGPTYEFCNDVIDSDAVAILLFSGPVAFSTAVGTGWQKIGPKGTVTSSGPGVIREVDGRPAHEFVARYLDTLGPASFGNPLAFTEKGMTEPYLRVAMGSDPETGAVSIMGSVPEGSEIQLTVTDPRQILTSADEAVGRALYAFPGDAKPEAALVFSCAVRRFLLGSQTGGETQLTRTRLGAGIPIAGLYCLGELAPVGDSENTRFLNETFVTLLLGT
jgi:hypothetical protein